jgi:hypothetical protein
MLRPTATSSLGNRPQAFEDNGDRLAQTVRRRPPIASVPVGRER